MAKGVALPVRPMDTMIPLRSVVFSSGGNLYAMAQRGARDVAPSSLRCARSSTLTTVPSISYGRECRRSSHVRQYSIDLVEAMHQLDIGIDRKPGPAHPVQALRVFGEGRPALEHPQLVGPEAELPTGRHARRPFDARTPAAALRGLMNVRASASTCRRLSSSKAGIGI